MINKSLRGLCSYLTGHAAEDFVRRWLEKKGYTFVAQNVRQRKGNNACELDLIMREKNTIVFVEVKKRQNAEAALLSVTPVMQKRLYKGAEAFLANNPQYAGYDCRFDVVCLDENNAITHLQNVIEG